ncbi:PLP-dependent aminotransferase family protein [Pseudoalteromonas luteoviolacea]
MMFTGLPLDKKNKAKHIQMAEQVRSAIQKGHIKPGEKLPSARALGQLFSVNRHTVMNALQNLVAEGWLVSELRKGYKVNSQLPIVHSTQVNEQDAIFEPITPQFAAVLPKNSSPTLDEYTYNFAGGLPDITQFPFDEFKRSINKVCRSSNAHALHYQNVAGEPELRAQLKAYLRKARGLPCDDVLVCNGSQEALFLTAHAFLNPGEGVAMESLGYPPARQAFMAAGGVIYDLKQDEQGLCVESLAQCFASSTVRLLYLTPLHQYPTTLTMSVARRMAIYKLCAQHGVFIIEDDYDHEFHYRCPPLQPMAANDPAQIVIYLSTFSKIMFAGARLGYITAAPAVLQQLVGLKKLINHKNDVLMQLAIADWMATGYFERHLRRMTKLYQQRCDSMAYKLNELKAQGFDIQFKQPDGGMAFWVDLKRDVSDLPAKLEVAKIFAHTEQAFCHAKVERETHIRLGFAGQEPEKISAGLDAIFALL